MTKTCECGHPKDFHIHSHFSCLKDVYNGSTFIECPCKKFRPELIKHELDRILEEQKKGKDSVLILPLDNWVRLLIDAGAEIRSLGPHEWIHTHKDFKPARRKAPRPSFLFILKGKEQESG